MSGDRTPMLFLPPRPPVPLPEAGVFVVGRSKSCDLTVSSLDASRRHAEIHVDPSGCLLRDLGSTNGTFVNGLKVVERRLRTGDRIDVGGEIVTFCEIDTALETPDAGERREAETRMKERPALGECMRGSLEEIPPFVVLQMLDMGRKTGLLEVDEGPVGRSRLWLEEGRPVHAETKGQHGFDAALAIVNSASGRFSFEPGRAAPERTIQASSTELLLEATRQLDEAR